MFQSLASLEPPYLTDDCRLVLLTANTRTCVIPQTNIQFGDRSFSNSGSKIWNSLPSAVRPPGLSFACLNNIVNPTCLMRFKTEALRGSCFYGHHMNSYMYVCIYVCMYFRVVHDTMEIFEV